MQRVASLYMMSTRQSRVGSAMQNMPIHIYCGKKYFHGYVFNGTYPLYKDCHPARVTFRLCAGQAVHYREPAMTNEDVSYPLFVRLLPHILVNPFFA